MTFVLHGPCIGTEETLGQSWIGDDVATNIALCEKQTISTVFLGKIPAGARVLEAGCGLGRWVFFLQRHNIDAVGVDSNANAIAAAKEYSPEAPVEFGDVEHLSYATESFDAVISLGVIEHFQKGPQIVLAEMNRVLKAHGMLFLSIPPANLLRTILVHPLLRLKNHINLIRGRKSAFAEYRFSLPAIRKIILEAGFEIEEEHIDELVTPLSIGLFVDIPQIHDPRTNWKLNTFGCIIRRILDSISPKISCGGLLFVCTKSLKIPG